MRDIESDYRNAYLDEHARCTRAGLTERAEAAAAVLRDHYGVDVTTATPAPAPEQAAAETPPETTAQRKPPARRTRAAKPKE